MKSNRIASIIIESNRIVSWVNRSRPNSYSYFRTKRMKFDDNKIRYITILLETHNMGTTAIA